MTEQPILFRGDMVRAIFAGQKDNTRRLRGLALVNVRPDDWRDDPKPGSGTTGGLWHFAPRNTSIPSDRWLRCPYGAPGDRLWVRENVYLAPPGFDDGVNANATDPEGRRRTVGYAADMNGDSRRCARDYGVKQTPCILMPRWACRLRLEIVSIRPERIQSITGADVLREGIGQPWNGRGVEAAGGMTAKIDGELRAIFARLWGAMHGDSWARNEWVWRVAFRRVDPVAEHANEAEFRLPLDSSVDAAIERAAGLDERIRYPDKERG